MFTKEYYNNYLKSPARKLRTHMTAAEEKIWYQYLRSFQPRVHRQRSMGRCIADFYIPKAKLVIEIDGSIHQEEKVRAKDNERTKFFNSLGIEVIRFTNEEVMTSFRRVCKSIRQMVVKRTDSF